MCRPRGNSGSCAAVTCVTLAMKLASSELHLLRSWAGTHAKARRRPRPRLPCGGKSPHPPRYVCPHPKRVATSEDPECKQRAVRASAAGVAPPQNSRYASVRLARPHAPPSATKRRLSRDPTWAHAALAPVSAAPGYEALRNKLAMPCLARGPSGRCAGPSSATIAFSAVHPPSNARCRSPMRSLGPPTHAEDAQLCVQTAFAPL